MPAFSPSVFRQYFPLLTDIDNFKSKPPIIYLDNAATTQKTQQVIEAQSNYYLNFNANVHRASHKLSTKATLVFEQARLLAKNFINAKELKEIIWTKGASESVNIVTQSFARKNLKPQDEIVLSVSEHHANIVPWQIVAEQTGAIIKVLPITKSGVIDISKLDEIITSSTKIVACSHISNVLGRINPIEAVIKKAKSVDAITLIDGAQSVAHLPIDVQALNCDFYVFSAHKMYGPTGVGVLYGRKELLESMSPYQGGGEMIKTVSFTKPTTFNDLPFKFEAGTPNISGVIAFKSAIEFIEPYLRNNDFIKYEKLLTRYCYEALARIPDILFISEGEPDIGLISFTVKGHHNHDIATALDSFGIAIRSGHHCAMPLMEYLAIDGCLRVSLSPYNTIQEIDLLIRYLDDIINSPKDNECIRQDIKKITTNQNNIALEVKSEQGYFPMDVIFARFSKSKSWDSLHREIMLLGKELPRLDKKLRDEHSLISGCESLAWLVSRQDSAGKFQLSADSDAKVIRGLLMIVLSIYNNKTTQEIKEVKIEAFFDALGLIHHLSPSRGNGLLAIVAKINRLTAS
jgi:cysteine desulfurase/selenocysteine lyase